MTHEDPFSVPQAPPQVSSPLGSPEARPLVILTIHALINGGFIGCGLTTLLFRAAEWIKGGQAPLESLGDLVSLSSLLLLPLVLSYTLHLLRHRLQNTFAWYKNQSILDAYNILEDLRTSGWYPPSKVKEPDQ